MSSPVIELEAELSNLLLQVRALESKVSWHQIGIVAHDIANALRTKDADNDLHTTLGRTALPNTLTALFSLSLHGGSIPDDAHTTPTLELLRVAANLCLDHDANRGVLLEAGFPQAIISLLEGYAELVSSPPSPQPLPLSIPHLKVIRTAIGVLLNACVGYDPIKDRLLSLEAVSTILKLSTSIYPPGSWQFYSSQEGDLNEAWTLRSGLSNWAWRTITELRDVKDESLLKISPAVLSVLTPTLTAFTPTTSSPPISDVITPDSELYHDLLRADFDTLEETCSLIESLSLDVEDVRSSLARGFLNPDEHDGVPCLQYILAFIESGSYPKSWRLSSMVSEGEVKRMEKSFDICKAALVKSVVEVAGEDINQEVLWDDSTAGKPGGEFVFKMVQWIKEYVISVDTFMGESLPRDDLAICASLSLGNLARREKHAHVLLSPPHSIALVLTSPHLLGPSVDIKLKHGIIGLLKHMAQSSSSPVVHDPLLQADVVRHISQSGIWDEKADNMAEVVQLSAIGVVKHMCGANVENAFILVLPQEQGPTGLVKIMSLVRRSDSVPIKSEGTRVLVNVIKSLWSSEIPLNPSNAESTPETEALLLKQKKKQTAIRLMLTQECASALANLLARSGRYPLLVNEGVVALSLLSTQRLGAPLVLKALLASLVEVGSPASTEPSSSTTSSTRSSPTLATPSSTRGQLPVPDTATDMLIGVLRNVDNPANFAVEVRLNVCSLLLQLGKYNLGEGMKKVKHRVQPVLEQLVEDLKEVQVDGKEGLLLAAAKEVSKNWASI
ncbi:hypothetical protein BDZ89DRAFT_976173 [Hymenopellis radicata]|nr:hypothetical protein BDZ89DRAFT_976173 [Hymenopellis radicata]